MFFFITIVLGSIWARPAWNTWWTWDPRLTTAAVTELIYIAYFMLRARASKTPKTRPLRRSLRPAGRLSAPITFMVIRLFRTIHPVVIGGANAEAEGGFEHDRRYAHRILLRPICLHHHLHRPDVAPHPPGRIPERGRRKKIESRLLTSAPTFTLPLIKGVTMFFQEITPDTSGYMIAGYATTFIILAIYVTSLFLRQRNLKQDMDMLAELEKTAEKPAKPVTKRGKKK
jgi:hypothetical protein